MNPVAHGIAEWATTDPDRIAVADVRRRVTFAELDALSGTLAHRLLELPDGWLPILVDRTASSMTAVHAAVRAGRRFSTIDHDVPAERLAHFFARLDGPRFAVVDRPELAAALPSDVTPILVPDVPDDPVPPVEPDPSADACVIFTSGSTGQPKGVVHTWEAFTFAADRVAHRDVPSDVPPHVAHFSPLSVLAGLFRVVDMSAGKSYTLADPTTMSFVDLADWLERGRFDVIALTPSTALSLVEHWRGERRLATVTSIRSYGEPLLWEHVPAMRLLTSPQVIVQVLYGASEVPSPSIRHDIGPDTPLGVGRVPLGWPLEEDRVWLASRDDLDVSGRPVGEIVIGGHTADRYLGDPELSAQRFVTDPERGRCWRSGDVATRRDDGAFELVGRIDDMVKIRGKLVEPAEAEHVLRSISGIRRVAVLPHGMTAGGHRLVAHLVLEPGASLTPGAVRRRLAEVLPAHLVPSLLVVHDELPQTSRGKLDRVELQSRPLRAWRTEAARRPHGDREWFVLGVAADLLEVSDLGPDDDLWDVGLDSLAAVELCATIADAGYGELDPPSLLQHRSPAAIATLLTGEGHVVRRDSDLVWFHRRSPGRPLVFIPGAGMTALSARALAAALGESHPVVVVEASGLHHAGRVDRTVDDAARSALAAVQTEMQHIAGLAEDPVVVAGFSAGGPVACELARHLQRVGRDVHVVLFDAGLSSGDGRRPGWERLRRASRSPLALARWAVRELRIARHRWRPGRYTAREERYTAFKRIARDAARSHRAAPVTFPVTVFEVEGSTAASRALPVAPHAAVHRVPGGHRSHLEAPHVSVVADLLRPLLADVPGAAPAPASPHGE